METPTEEARGECRLKVNERGLGSDGELFVNSPDGKLDPRAELMRYEKTRKNKIPTAEIF